MTRISKSKIVAVVAALYVAVPSALTQSRDSLPSAEDIVSRIAERDAGRRSSFSGYTVSRRYEVVNKDRHAEMLVQVVCAADGGKQFSILHEEGSRAIRNHVLRKMLEEETNASRRDTRQSTRIIPGNYSFEMVGTDIMDSRPTYVLELTPKNKSKYLIRGRIWVDATDYAIARIEGSPAQNPSFWTKRVHFVHTYQKVGDLWLAASTKSVTDVRVFGTAELSITDFNYSPANPPTEARLRP
jgi:outer membrane lipoprotein-sorting protein